MPAFVADWDAQCTKPKAGFPICKIIAHAKAKLKITLHTYLASASHIKILIMLNTFKIIFN